MNSININSEGYSAPNGADDLQKNWAAEYARREDNKHREALVLDHPDGSVTPEKLSDEVKARISEAYETAQTASETASTAKATAEVAKNVSDIAKTTADDAFNYSNEARGMANDADARSAIATDTAEAAQQRATSAEAKADTAVVTAGTAVQKADDVQSDLEEHGNNTDIHTTAEEKNTWNNKAEKDHTHDDYATHEVVSNSTYGVYQLMINDVNYLQSQIDEKANKPVIMSGSWQSVEYEFAINHNIETRLSELTTLSFTFGNGEYAEDYASGLSFDSGEIPTAIDYTDSGILNWVGTDCATSDGLSIFQPSANTHYDIVFYFNGVQFIGLVNGFVPATGNEAV